MYCKSQNCIQNILPESAMYFKEEFMDMKIVETPVGMSNEGQNLSGVKLVVELNIKEKVTYVACEPTQSVHAAYFETYKSMFVILPEMVGDKYTCDLVRSGRISVIPYVEGKHARQLDCRNIHRCVMLFLDVKMC